MKTAYPDYYNAFDCLAGGCKHTCCRGWEIDIDADALTFYQSVPGDFGNRLRDEISLTEQPHFLLKEDDRCPFLNKDNLCDMILCLGETALCQICRDHPRFRNFFSDRTEIGLGLCCEAAARLILIREEKFRLLDDGAAEALTAEEEWILEIRAEYIRLMQDRSVPLLQRWELLEKQTGVSIEARSPAQWASIYQGLERLEPTWENRLAQLKNRAAFSSADSTLKPLELPLEQLTVYFLYRHLPGALLDGDIPARTAFSILSARFIAELYASMEEKSLDFFLELAREYSAEIEYSEDNLCTLLDHLSA